MFKLSSKSILLGAIGIVLILIGISTFKEGFKAGMPGIRCGVDLPTCSNNLQCMNGFCENSLAPRLPKNELSVFP